jgi:hypothetical protein
LGAEIGFTERRDNWPNWQMIYALGADSGQAMVTAPLLINEV